VSLNGKQIGEKSLTGLDAGNGVEFKDTVSLANTVHEIRHHATDYSGNDFAIDDITLTQVS